MNPLLSDNTSIMAGALAKAINDDRASKMKAKAREGVRYYNYGNDILSNRIFYLDKDQVLREDKFASNIRIPHAFFPEIVDQKTQVLLSNPVEIICEDEGLKAELDQYYDEDFQVFLQDAITGSSQKGFEYIFARTTAEDRLKFQVADSLCVIPIYDDEYNLRRLVRYVRKFIQKDGRRVAINLAEVWDDEQVWFFKSEDKKAYRFDTEIEPNPRPHVLAKNAKGELAGRGYGQIPFYRLQNNVDERTDLEPIKDIIDDYDLMNAFLSNNLQDFAEAIYVVKGFKGNNLDELRQNIKAKKTVGVGDNGGVDIKTVAIPVEGRQTKMNIDKENIYKFGMAFDSTAIGDGNITNIVIKSRYSLLIMKVNKTETRLRAMLKWINQMVIADINRRTGKAYSPDQVEFEFVRELMVNETDLVTNEKTTAETRQIAIQTILEAAPQLPSDEVLRLICEQFELDFEDIQSMLEEEPYTKGLAEGTDSEVIADATAGQVESGTGEAKPEGVQEN